MSLRIDSKDGPRWRVTQPGEKIVLVVSLRRLPRVSGFSLWRDVDPTRDFQLVCGSKVSLKLTRIEADPPVLVSEPIDAPGRLRCASYRLKVAADSEFYASDRVNHHVWIVDSLHYELSRYAALVAALCFAWIVWPLLPLLSAPNIEAFLPLLGAFLLLLVPGARKAWEIIRGEDRADHVDGRLRGFGHRLGPTLLIGALGIVFTLCAYGLKPFWSPAAIYNATGASVQYRNVGIEAGSTHIDYEWNSTNTRGLRSTLATLDAGKSFDDVPKENQSRVKAILDFVGGPLKFCVLSPDISTRRWSGVTTDGSNIRACRAAKPLRHIPRPLPFTIMRPYGVTLACAERYLRKELSPLPDSADDFYRCDDDERFCPLMTVGCEPRRNGPWKFAFDASTGTASTGPGQTGNGSEGKDEKIVYITSPEFALRGLAEDASTLKVTLGSGPRAVAGVGQEVRAALPRADQGPTGGGLPVPQGLQPRAEALDNVSIRFATEEVEPTTILQISFEHMTNLKAPLPFPAVKTLRYDLSYPWGPRDGDRTQIGEGFFRVPPALSSQKEIRSIELIPVQFSANNDVSFMFRRGSEATWDHSSETSVRTFVYPHGKGAYSLKLRVDLPPGSGFALDIPDTLAVNSLRVTLAGGHTATCEASVGLREVRLAAMKLPDGYDLDFEAATKNVRSMSYRERQTLTVILCVAASGPDAQVAGGPATAGTSAIQSSEPSAEATASGPSVLKISDVRKIPIEEGLFVLEIPGQLLRGTRTPKEQFPRIPLSSGAGRDLGRLECQTTNTDLCKLDISRRAMGTSKVCYIVDLQCRDVKPGGQWVEYHDTRPLHPTCEQCTEFRTRDEK